MAIRYWEYEDAPLKEKLKDPNVRDVAKIYFDNDTKAYRFSKALCEVKKRNGLRLKDCGDELPMATWKRYLDFGVMVGLLKHEDGVYAFTDRYSRPLKNISLYIKAWAETPKEEDLLVLFANARTDRQKKRGGRSAAEAQAGDGKKQAQGQEQG